MTQVLDFAGLLELLGHDGFTSVCHQPPGGAFATAVVESARAPAAAAEHASCDVWFGVNPVAGPARANQGRGTADQVVRLAALYADLDVKEGGLSSFEAARAVVDVLSEMLGTRPSAITMSGHGLQPYWPLATSVTGSDAKALLRRFGRLVAGVASRHDGHVDSVFDLARVLRVPGTANHKSEPAVPVLCFTDSGYALEPAQVRDTLDAYGAPERPEDRETLCAVVSSPADWGWAAQTCSYATGMVSAWATDSPPGRHPWLLAQATRLALAHRNGCVTEADHTQATARLVGRFRALLATGEARKEGPGEVADALSWATLRAASRSDQDVAAELGGHQHGNAALTLGKQPSAPWTPRIIQGGIVDGTSALARAPLPARTLERSEDGHAEHLIASHGELIRYCPQREVWLAWDGHVWRWQPKGGGAVREYAKTVARAFPAADTGATSHKRRSLSAAGISGCLRTAQTDDRVSVDLGSLDADPYAINTPAGLVDLRTGSISPPDPLVMCTKTTPLAPDESGIDVWQSFLADTFNGNRPLATYVQRLVGLTLVGSVREQLLAFCHGVGANGKSTLVEAVTHALGTGETGYATSAPAEMLMIRRHEAHPAELAQLAGARMVVCSELDDGQRFAEAKIKLLTGSDSINARFLYGQPFTFRPSHTIWLVGNHRPQAGTGGLAFWRRVKLLEFANIVPEESRDPALGERLRIAAPAILKWAIQGAVDYFSAGLQEPDAVRSATRAYASDQDTVGRFVDEMVHLAPGVTAARVAAVELRAAYEKWCTEAGESPVSARRLTTDLADRFGVRLDRSHGRRYYTSLTLLADDDESSQEAWWQR